MPPKRLRNPLWLCTALVISMTTLCGVGQASAFQDANLSGTPARLATLTSQPSAKTADGDCKSGSLDGDRFSVERQSVWRGTRKPGSVCQTTFAAPTPIGSILQITGVHPYQLKNAFRNDAWQVSDDGEAWTMLHETVVIRETRRFRIHRLQQAITPKKIRLVVKLSHSAALAPREVEFDSAVDAEIAFSAWIVAVSSDEDPDKVSLGIPVISLARLCEGWLKAPAQTIWCGDFDPRFAFTEPRPLYAFLSAILLEWCQCSRKPWRGTQEVLKCRRLPLWGACGGAQMLAMLKETGVDQPCDCPRCQHSDQPLLFIDSHLGHTGKALCGDDSECIAERGKFRMKIEQPDPVFSGLPEVFEIVESQIGQIDPVPKGWRRQVTKGPAAHTVNPCLQTDDGPIYAAQFHMKTYDLTIDISKRIMSNFQGVAREWHHAQAQNGRIPPRDGQDP